MSRPRAEGADSEPSPYVLTTTGEPPVSWFSKANERLDKHMLELLCAELGRPARTRERLTSTLGSFAISDEPPQLA